MYNVTMQARSRNSCSHGKVISITYSECVFVGFFIQHAKRMRPVILSLWPVRLDIILPNYRIAGPIFGKTDR